MGCKHAGAAERPLCGRWSDGDAMDNVFPDCEPCQMVEAWRAGTPIVQIARDHSCPPALVMDILRSCPTWPPRGKLAPGA